MKQLFVVFISFIFVSPAFASVTINEFSANASPEWVEFYNASDSADYLKSYYLDDDISFTEDSGSGTKKLLTALVATSVTYPYIDITSFLNNGGDYVVLFDSVGTLIDQYQYSSDPGDGITIGRTPDHTGGFSILVSATKGSQNSVAPTTTPVPTSSPTSISTPTKTPTPTIAPVTNTPTSTKIPSPTKTHTPTPIPTDDVATSNQPTVEPTAMVLGATESSPSGRPLLPLAVAAAMVGLGLALIAGVLVWQKRSVILKP